MNPTLLPQVFSTAHTISAVVPARSQRTVFLHLLSELGEVAEEALIHNKDLHKPAGPDGVVGEVADALNCMADLVWLQCHTPHSTTTDLAETCAAIEVAVGIASLDTLPATPFDAALESFTVQASHLYGLRNPDASQHPKKHYTGSGLVRALLVLAKAADPTLTDSVFLDRYATKCEKWRNKSMPQ